MAESSPVFRKSDVQRILRALRDGKIKVIQPQFVFEQGWRYPEVENIAGVNRKTIAESLEELTEVGILIAETRCDLAICPTCGSHKLTVRIVCPICGSTNLKKGSVIEHFNCGHLDLEELFKKGDLLVCPRCGKTLRLIGVDFRRLGILFVCESCGQRFPAPKRLCRCDSGHDFEEKDEALRKIYAYRFNSDKTALIERVTLDFRSLIKQLAVNGWSAKTHPTIRGQSGVEHEFAFGFWTPGDNPAKEKPYLLADVNTSTEPAGSIAVLAFSAKAMDASASEKILIAMPRLNDEARAFANSYGIAIVEAETAFEVIENTKSLVKRLIEQHETKKVEPGISTRVWAEWVSQ
jgi:predicted RNA-binding Zn-ribbon protein involved in translation (DUF1610 family)